MKHTASPKPAGAPRGFVKLPKGTLARTDLSLAAKLTYSAIRDCMRQGNRAWPSFRRLATMIGVTENTALRAVREIEDAGLIRVERRGRGRSNVYHLPDEDAEDKDAGSTARTATLSESESTAETATLEQTKVPQNLRSSTARIAAQVPQNLRSKKTRRKKKTRCAARDARNGSPHQQLITHFVVEWSRRVGGGAEYQFARAKDAAAAQTILTAVHGDLPRAKRIVDHYLADRDPWLAKTGHKLAILASQSQLPRHVEATAPRNDSDDEQPGGPTELPAIAEAGALWPDDVDAHPAEYQAIAQAVEAGRLPTNIVKQHHQLTGPEFRAAVARRDKADAVA